MPDLRPRVSKAVAHFWKTRSRQGKRSRRDQGARAEVTGGAHLDGFIQLLTELLVDAGVPDATIYREQRIELPGYYRATKKWDLLVVVDNRLLGALELKAQVGPSFGNNCNNRAEEAVGNASDFWEAFRSGAFRESPEPWLGYLVLVEEAPGSTHSVGLKEPHFPALPEFQGTSYLDRYVILGQKLVQQRLYRAVCVLASERAAGSKGAYREPKVELGFHDFAASFVVQAATFARTRR